MSWFSHYHGREELATEPGTTAGTNRLLDNGDLNRRVLAKFVGARETSRTGTDYDDIGICMADHVHHVPAGHLPRHDRLPDGLEFKGAEIVRRRRRSGDGETGGRSRFRFQVKRKSGINGCAMKTGVEKRMLLRLGGGERK